jgi:hypothetical protein
MCLNFCSFKNVALLYSRVGAGAGDAGASSKLLPGTPSRIKMMRLRNTAFEPQVRAPLPLPLTSPPPGLGGGGGVLALFIPLAVGLVMVLKQQGLGLRYILVWEYSGKVPRVVCVFM